MGRGGGESKGRAWDEPGGELRGLVWPQQRLKGGLQAGQGGRELPNGRSLGSRQDQGE